ncbi:MAG: DUF3473 domain-containing protein [Deltaproteobacteria bacterium]|nr:DUF3473 domain-containing protein [Deltaproteobacteria bacterium]MBW2662732.1 DUF3473 domain-containing protein [Deltaproteobacteria bacterium]
MSYHILLTIDVEDWFQVENFKQYIPFSSWSCRELRVEENTHRLLDLLDSVKSAESLKVKGESSKVKAQSNQQPETSHRIKATFFILAWIAERFPDLVREIHFRGHEVASHGYLHNLCNQQSHEELKKDLIDSKKLLEDIIGAPVYGYRAPSFSINNDILKTIEDCGYFYDSSYNSFAVNKRYGHIDISQNRRKGIAIQISKTDHAAFTKSTINNQQSTILYELPISNLKSGSHILPWGGGGYFRLIPLPVFKMGVQSILERQGVYLFYLHPWEVDPEQPRVNHASKFFKFRHYINLDRTASKLLSFIEAFKECRFITCRDYLCLKGESSSNE